MAGKKSLPCDMWQVARLLWENTDKITDADIVAQLEVEFGNDAPKSTGTISKRRKKEEWQKNTLLAAAKRKNKQEERGNNRNSSEPKTSNVIPKPNKAQTLEELPSLEEKKAFINGIMDNVVMGAKERAAVIVKTRKRYRNLGDLFDQSLHISLSIKELAEKALQAELDMNKVSLDDGSNVDEDGQPSTERMDKESEAEMAVENLKRALMLSKSLSDTTASLSASLKVISEVELPLCGITPEDFSQSDQERRLGALEALGDIHSEEAEARARLKVELDERLEWIKETADSGDFGRTQDQDDVSIENIDYTSVD